MQTEPHIVDYKLDPHSPWLQLPVHRPWARQITSMTDQERNLEARALQMRNATSVAATIRQAGPVQLEAHFQAAGAAVLVVSKLQADRRALWDTQVAEASGCKQLLVESWRHEPGAAADACQAEGCCMNADGLHLQHSSWTGGRDHSKWAVCCEQALVCFGDLNRAATQLQRAGTAVCIAKLADGDLGQTRAFKSNALQPAEVLHGWLWFRLNAHGSCQHCAC